MFGHSTDEASGLAGIPQVSPVQYNCQKGKTAPGKTITILLVERNNE